MMIFLERRKLKRTGILPAFLAGGLLSAAVPAPRFPALSHAGPVFQIPIPSFFLPVFSHNKRDRRSVPFSSAFLLLPHERHTAKSAPFP